MLDLFRLRAASRDGQLTALRNLAARLGPGDSAGAEVIRSAARVLGIADELSTDFPDLFLHAPAARCPFPHGQPPGASLESLQGPLLARALAPFVDKRVVMHLVGAAGERQVVSGVLQSATEHGSDVVTLRLGRFSPSLALAERSPGEQLMVPESHNWAKAPEGRTVRTMRVGPDSSALRILRLHEAPLDAPPETGAGASTVDTPNSITAIARAVDEGRAYPQIDLTEMERALSERPDDGPLREQIRIQLARELRGIMGGVLRVLVDRMIISGALVGLTALPVEKAHATYDDSLRYISEQIVGVFQSQLAVDLGPRAEQGRRALPDHIRTAKARADQLLEFRFRHFQVEGTEATSLFAAGAMAGVRGNERQAALLPQLFLTAHSRLPTPDELQDLLEQSRGLVRHDAAGADMDTFSLVHMELLDVEGRYSPAHFTLQGRHADFDPKLVQQFVQEYGTWLTFKNPWTTGCPARALGTLDTFAAVYEAIAVKAFALHAQRPGGVVLSATAPSHPPSDALPESSDT